MSEHIYVVVWSMASNGYHSIDTELYEKKEDCMEFFKKKYNDFVESVKEHDVPVWSFYEDMYKNGKQPPKDGSYILLFDMAENSKTITYTHDGVERVSFQIEYFCKPFERQTNKKQKL